MKLTLEQRPNEQDEVVIRYSRMTEEIENLIAYVKKQDHTLLATPVAPAIHTDSAVTNISTVTIPEQVVLKTNDIIYIESVDATTFVYTKEQVCRTAHSLASLQSAYADEGFFRCSKSMIINIYRIVRLKSEPANRIRCTMDNGEQVMISRRYAKELRRILKGATG